MRHRQIQTEWEGNRERERERKRKRRQTQTDTRTHKQPSDHRHGQVLQPDFLTLSDLAAPEARCCTLRPLATVVRGAPVRGAPLCACRNRHVRASSSSLVRLQQLSLCAGALSNSTSATPLRTSPSPLLFSSSPPLLSLLPLSATFSTHAAFWRNKPRRAARRTCAPGSTRPDADCLFSRNRGARRDGLGAHSLHR